MQEYEPVIWATVACIAGTKIATSALTSGFTMVCIIERPTVDGPCLSVGSCKCVDLLYFLIFHSSSALCLAGRGLKGHLLSRLYFSFKKVLEDLFTKYCW